jgi:prolyl oligopeptidase
VRDPYRWLEDGDAESVRLWTEAQGRHTREHLDALPGREQIRARLSALFSIGTLTPPSVHRGRYFHVRREGDQQQPLLYVRDEMRGADRVLVDPSGLSPDAATALDWLYPSPHGALLAYGLSEAGSEKNVLRVKDVTDGRVRDDVIPWTRAASPEWLPDASASTTRAIRSPPRFRPARRTFVTVAEGEDALFGVLARGERLYLHTNLGAPRFRLLVADPRAPGRESWKELIPEGPDVLESVAVVGNTILASWLKDASSHLTLHDRDGRRRREVPLPEIGTIARDHGRVGRQ